MAGVWLPKEHVLVETSLVETQILSPVESLPIDFAARFGRAVGQPIQGFGLVVAMLILGVWAVSLGLLLSLPIAEMSLWFKVLAVFWQTFLWTGLFITAHDAMHGSVYPEQPMINHAIGRVAVLCYGLFSYQSLLRKHWLHHRHPASPRDPDFHDGEHDNPLRWYVHFMIQYWSWRRLLGLVVLFQIACYLLHTSYSSVMLFWAIPSVLSSIQLFFFGTFLPHRRPAGGYSNSHHAQTTAWPILWSFLTCYHFGYHQEHHEYPHVPWWLLPSVHRAKCFNTQKNHQGNDGQHR
jgi:beta-carotene ketolase (CrtW type)